MSLARYGDRQVDPKINLQRALDDVLDWFPVPKGLIQLRIYNNVVKQAKDKIASMSPQEAAFKRNQLRIDLSD
jgi:hypothetical protein